MQKERDKGGERESGGMRERERGTFWSFHKGRREKSGVRGLGG